MIDVIIASPQEMFVRLQSLMVDPESPMLSAEQIKEFIGKWWKIPSDLEGAMTQNVAPDPALLRAQAEVIRVTRDDGLHTIRGREAYKYAVEIDPEKLLTYMRQLATEKGQEFSEEEIRQFLATFNAVGELWIDSETFYVHQLAWKITPSDASTTTPYTLGFTANLHDHGNAPPIVPPADAVEFSPDALGMPMVPPMPMDESSFPAAPVPMTP